MEMSVIGYAFILAGVQLIFLSMILRGLNPLIAGILYLAANFAAVYAVKAMRQLDVEAFNEKVKEFAQFWEMSEDDARRVIIFLQSQNFESEDGPYERDPYRINMVQAKFLLWRARQLDKSKEIS